MLSTLPDNSGDAMNEIPRIITEVCHFFSRLDFLTIKFQLFCVVYAMLMLTSNVSSLTPVCHCNIIIWLVFTHFVSSQIHDNWRQQVFFAQMMSWTLRYDVIDHPFPVNSQYLKMCGIHSPAQRWDDVQLRIHKLLFWVPWSCWGPNRRIYKLMYIKKQDSWDCTKSEEIGLLVNRHRWL